MLGLLTTIAADWKIAFDDTEFLGLGLGYRNMDFILASPSAQVIQRVQLAGLSASLGVKLSKPVEKAKEISDWLHELNSSDQNLFWPLDVLQPFSANDLDYATGSAGIYHIVSTKVLRFDARQMSPHKRAQGLLFRQPGEGLPIPDQALNLQVSIVGGDWYLRSNQK